MIFCDCPAMITIHMSAKKQKILRKKQKNIPKLEPIFDEAWRQCSGSQEAFNKWMEDALDLLYRQPDYPIEKLTPSELLSTVMREIFEQLQEEAHSDLQM